MRYFRKRNGTMEECPASPYMGATWYVKNDYLPYSGALSVDRLDIVDGEIVELPAAEPTVEWVSSEAFINALYALVPAEALAGVLQDPDALKTGVAGLALLSSDAAPGGHLNLLDVRVEPWLGTFGLTLEEVRTKMAESAWHTPPTNVY